MKIFILIAVIVFIVWFFFLRKKTAGSEQKKKIQHGKYHCVSIETGKQACEAVMKIKDIRILSAKAPVLPLIACDCENCECHFHHHEDRREGERRGAYNKAQQDILSSTMQLRPRQGKDRRQSAS